APGGGTQALREAALIAQKNGTGIYLESLTPESNAFYEKWGFKPESDEDGEPFYNFPPDKVDGLISQIDAYLAGTAAPAAPPLPLAAPKFKVQK
ncbi:hypothetical protein, partial [Acinetobacter baumannii]|uniref:hypothetical protein n=1 Tax=Acinetobacter baumannii TaxID=470 RepID=UPI003AF5355F